MKLDEIKEIISRCHYEYVSAYRYGEGENGSKILSPRSDYPDLASYQAAMIFEKLNNN